MCISGQISGSSPSGHPGNDAPELRPLIGRAELGMGYIVFVFRNKSPRVLRRFAFDHRWSQLRTSIALVLFLDTSEMACSTNFVTVHLVLYHWMFVCRPSSVCRSLSQLSPNLLHRALSKFSCWIEDLGWMLWPVGERTFFKTVGQRSWRSVSIQWCWSTYNYFVVLSGYKVIWKTYTEQHVRPSRCP